MTVRDLAIATAASLCVLSLGGPWRAASAQTSDAQPSSTPAIQRGVEPGSVKPSGAKPNKAKSAKAHARKATGHPAKAAAAPAAGAVPQPGRETEASSLERRRKAFFDKKPDEAGPGEDAPSAGVTLGGSGGLSPGMGFKF